MGELWPDEPDYKKLHEDWTKAPTPTSTGALIKSLDSTFDTAISRYAGGGKSPLLKSHAKRLALDAIKTYDPARGTRLPSHVMNHLKGLQRFTKAQQPLRVPERASMEQAYLNRMQAELGDTLGRDPTTFELADHVSFSPAKITRLRSYMPGVAEGSLPEGAEVASANPYSADDRDQQMLQVLHSELEPRDQQILEWSLGMYGNKKMENQMIAAKLGLSPGAVSQRKLTIQRKMDQMRGLMYGG